LYFVIFGSLLLMTRKGETRTPAVNGARPPTAAVSEALNMPRTAHALGTPLRDEKCERPAGFTFRPRTYEQKLPRKRAKRRVPKVQSFQEFI
jgi:hypothetical protein